MPGSLEIDHLVKHYGRVVALSDMSFTVRRGELFGFVGSNGAGKTTTMRIAMGVLAADSGEVRWDDRPLTLERRRRIGYMPEERGLYPRMKVGEQLIYLGRLHGMTPAAAKRAMESWTERLGVAARRGDEVQKLSLGNQQRVQLSAALLHDPELLVLDEPFSGLDPVAVDVMSEVLRERCAAGVPVIFSSHQLELVERICDRVGIVRGGRLVAVGTVDELRKGSPVSLLVDAPQAPDGWADNLPGVSLLRRDGTRTVLRIDPGADDQLILQTALQNGPVHEFARQLPTLTELFRDVVHVEETPELAGERGMTQPEEDFGLSSTRAVAMVANREVMTRIRSKAFVISTVILVVGILVGILIAKVTRNTTPTEDVGFLPSQQTSVTAFREVAQAVGVKVTTPIVVTRADGETQLRNGKLDALVTGSTGGFQVAVKKELSDSLTNVFTVLSRQGALNEQLTKAGVNPQAVNQAVGSAHVDVAALEPKNPQQGQRLAIGIIAGILVYIALLVYGQAVAQGVVEEKTSRIVELLLTAIRPWQLLLGKVIGIGTLGLAQLLLGGVVALVAGLSTHALTLPGSVAAGAILGSVGWFLLGYLAYALMFAAIGALVSRQEDVGGAVAPLSMLIIFPYVLGISILPGNPDSHLLGILSMIPLFSPTLMPMRSASGVPGWETAVAVALTVALIAGLVWLAGRIYGNAVTRTGARVRLRDALRPI